MLEQTSCRACHLASGTSQATASLQQPGVHLSLHSAAAPPLGSLSYRCAQAFTGAGLLPGPALHRLGLHKSHLCHTAQGCCLRGRLHVVAAEKQGSPTTTKKRTTGPPILPPINDNVSLLTVLCSAVAVVSADHAPVRVACSWHAFYLGMNP